jgi:hypothetical protein
MPGHKAAFSRFLEKFSPATASVWLTANGQERSFEDSIRAAHLPLRDQPPRDGAHGAYVVSRVGIGARVY